MRRWNAVFPIVAAPLLLILACGCSNSRPQYVASRGGVREVVPKDPDAEPNYNGAGEALVQILNGLAARYTSR